MYYTVWYQHFWGCKGFSGVKIVGEHTLGKTLLKSEPNEPIFTLLTPQTKKGIILNRPLGRVYLQKPCLLTLINLSFITGVIQIQGGAFLTSQTLLIFSIINQTIRGGSFHTSSPHFIHILSFNQSKSPYAFVTSIEVVWVINVTVGYGFALIYIGEIRTLIIKAFLVVGLKTRFTGYAAGVTVGPAIGL